jgi:hypothetical protein
MKRLSPVAMWMLAALCAALAVLLGWGFVNPAWYSRGGFAAGVINGHVEVAWSNGGLSRQSATWRISTPAGFASILVAPRSMWRPTTSRAAIGMGAGPGAAAMFRLTVVYVPLWPLVVVAGGGAGLLRWRRGCLPIPGHCRCGYDLHGLTAERCPECGHAVGGVTARLAAAARGWLRPQRSNGVSPLRGLWSERRLTPAPRPAPRAL